MALDSWLSQTGQVQRRPEVLDAYGNDASNYEDVGEVLPGRLVEKRQRVWSDERKEALVVTSYLWLTPASSDVRERDRIVVDGTIYTITGRLIRSARALHHLSLTLERVA